MRQSVNGKAEDSRAAGFPHSAAHAIGGIWATMVKSRACQTAKSTDQFYTVDSEMKRCALMAEHLTDDDLRGNALQVKR